MGWFSKDSDGKASGADATALRDALVRGEHRGRRYVEPVRMSAIDAERRAGKQCSGSAEHMHCTCMADVMHLHLHMHLHMHMQTKPDLAAGEGLPAQFRNYRADGVLQERGEPVRGQTVIVDGTTGRIVVNPSRETLRFYRLRRRRLARERQRLERLRALPGVTRDDARIALHANLELPREIDLAITSGAEGIGLLRTEFMFMNRDTPPDEEEQYLTLRTLVEGMNGQPVTIRTLDVGGEKLAYSLGNHILDAVNPAPTTANTAIIRFKLFMIISPFSGVFPVLYQGGQSTAN